MSKSSRPVQLELLLDFGLGLIFDEEPAPSPRKVERTVRRRGLHSPDSAREARLPVPPVR